MKRLIRNQIIFLLPLIICGIVVEISLRHIPNEYAFKEEYLNKNSDHVEVLFLGSSYAYFGVNPVYVKEKSFNTAHVSQTVDLDLAILEKYRNKWGSLKYIVLPIAYNTLYEQLKNTVESWRITNYTLYYGIPSFDIQNHSEVLSNKLNINLMKLYSYYWKEQNRIRCNRLGWGIDYNSRKQLNLEETGKESAKRNTIKDDQTFEKNKEVLGGIIGFARKNHIRILFYTPPAYKAFVACLDKHQLEQTFKTAETLEIDNDNVSYVNLLNDTSFHAKDFYDADHLNEIGAKKLTIKIENLIIANNKSLVAKK